MARGKEELVADYEDRRQLIALSAEQSKLLDQWLMSLSAGAFGLSLLFIGTLEDKRPLALACVEALVFAWAAFGVCVALRLITFKTSVKMVMGQIAFIDDRIKGNKSEEKKIWWLPRRWTRFLSYASLLFFFVGAASLGYFAITNL